jgi:diguanylate cyclase (GGDEF)-like protein
MKKQNIKKYKSDSEFTLLLNKENIQRLTTMIAIILVIVMFQAIGYSLTKNDDFNLSLINTKFMIIGISIGILFLFNKMNSNTSFFMKHSEKLIYLTTFLMLLSALVNTFEAQHISSDISIYIMILFAITASVRIKPPLMLSLLIIIYSLFVFYLPIYQPNKAYLLAHIINGLIVNILAYIISRTFYTYSIRDYEDKIAIKNQNRELQYLSEKDSLTNLYNKRMSDKLLDKFIKNSNNNEKTLYLSVIDLDYFKTINDEYGHLYGDEILKKFATSLKKSIRETDIAIRYGGDEFLIIFQDVSNKEINIILNRLLNEVSNPNFEGIQLSFSCGVAKWKNDTKEDLFERADSYMYKAKNAGRNNILIETLNVD